MEMYEAGTPAYSQAEVCLPLLGQRHTFGRTEEPAEKRGSPGHLPELHQPPAVSFLLLYNSKNHEFLHLDSEDPTQCLQEDCGGGFITD